MTSGVRASRTTLPGPGGPEPIEPKTDPDGRGLPSDVVEVPIDMDDLERVSLVEMPHIARYGRYELLGRLAYGGMAEIYLAREANVSAHRMLVIKRVLPHVAADRHFVDMFVDEARLAMQLNHPHICHVYSFGEESGSYYIAMEWVNGKTLSQIVRRAKEGGGLPVPIALKIIAQVAEALDYAHRACDAAGEPLGVVHRDVSPQNVMVSYDGVVKLLDFGIAKASSHSTRTEAGVIKGKFAYMSPQQCVGEPIDSRADIFALGLCLFEVLTGRNPFRRKTEYDTMTRIVGDATPSVRQRRPEVPEAIDRIIEKALMKQPDARYQTAGEMQLDIEAALAEMQAVVNSARVGELVSRLFHDEVRDGPALDMRMSSPPESSFNDSKVDASLPRPRPPSATELEAERLPPPSIAPPAKPKRSSLGPLAVVLVLVLLVGVASAGGALAWFFFDLRARPIAGPPSAAPLIATPAEIPVVPPAVPAPPLPAPAPSETGPSAPTTGSVLVSSAPEGATVHLGERGPVGTTPLELGMLAPGSYDVRVALAGHDDWNGQVAVSAGERASIHAALSARRRAPAAPPGELSLNTQPWSKVYLGGRLLGTTPLGRVAVPSGSQRLRLVDRDGNEHRRTVRVPAGGHVAESFDLRE